MARFAIINSTLVENVILANSTPTIPGRTVVLLTANQAVGPGDTYSGGVFTPYVPSASEIEALEAPDRLRMVLPFLRIWAGDAKTEAELTAMTAPQRLARQAVIEDRLAKLARALAYLIRRVGESD